MSLRRSGYIAVAVALLFGVTSAKAVMGATPPEAAPARSAAAFLDSFGVNTHMGGPSYRDPAAVARQLLMINMKHVRDSLNIGSELPALRQLNAVAGAKFDLLDGYYASDGGSAVITNAFANVEPIAPMIEAFEGPNEPDWFGAWYNGVHFDPKNMAAGSASAVIDAQKLLYRLVKGHPATRNIPVFCPAFSYPAGGIGSPRSAVGNLAAYCDVAPLHDYPENAGLGRYLPYQHIRAWAQYPPNVTAVGRPVVITEGGWPTARNSHTGVDEATQAKYILEYLLDAFSLGIARTYLYELADDVNDPSASVDEDHYGLFHANGTPKIAATTLANVKDLLQSGGVTPGSLSYSIDDMPPNGHALVLEKSNGIFVIALWHEADLWDGTKHAAIPLAAAQVTLHLASPANMQLYDPLVGTGPLGASRKTADLPVSIPDHPIFVLVGG